MVSSLAAMKDRGYAIAFFLVLVIICLGAYLSITTILLGKGLPAISFPGPTPSAALEPTPTPTLSLHPTETPTSFPSVVTPVAPTATPLLLPTPTLAVSPTGSPEPTPSETPTTPAPPTPAGGILYQVFSAERTECGQVVAYIRGTVYDAQGSPQGGVRVRLYNDWGYDEVKETKGGADLGNYDFVMGRDSGFFHLEVVDSARRPVSLPHDVDYKAGCTIYVDWRGMK